METTHAVRSISDGDYDDESSCYSSNLNFSSYKGYNSGAIERRSVHFASVEIRVYYQTIGDNPAVTYGPPIMLDWEYDELSPVTIEEYEAARPASSLGGVRRDATSLFLSSMDRRRILKKRGVTEEELNRAAQEAERIRKERALTNTLLPAMMVEEALESTKRKVLRFIRGKSPSPTKFTSSKAEKSLEARVSPIVMNALSPTRLTYDY